MADSELQAVESALNTLVLAQSEKALQKVVTRLLPAILAALSTKSAAARAKCIETLQHINVRVRAAPQIQLPFDAVLDVVTASNAAIMTVNVGIQGGYVKRCFDRLTPSQQAATFTKLANVTPHVSSVANRDLLYLLTLRALTQLSDVQRQQQQQQRRSINSSSNNNKDEKTFLLLDRCNQFGLDGLLNYWLRALRFKLQTPVSDAALTAIVRAASEYAGVRQPEKAAKVMPHLLIAAGMASRSTVADIGEDALKKIDTCDVLAESDPELMQTLFALFVDPATEIAQRILILGKGLLVVPLCASCFPEVLDVIKLSVHAPGIPTRFQALGMQFVSLVIKQAEQAVFDAHVHVLIELMLRLVRNDTNGSPSFPDAVRAFGFTAMGEIVVRTPAFMTHTQTPTQTQTQTETQQKQPQQAITPQLFFDAAQDERLPTTVRASAAQSLVAMARVLTFDSDAPNSRAAYASVIDTLVRTLQNYSDSATSARAAAVHWANECFAYSDCDARLLNIIAAADPKQDIRQNAQAGLSPKRWSYMDGKSSAMNGVSGKNPSDSDVNMTERRPQVTRIVQVFSAYTGPKPPPVIEAYLSFSFYLIRNDIVTRGQLDVANIDQVDRFFQQSPAVKDALVNMNQLADDVVFERIHGHSASLEKAGLAIALFASKISALSVQCAARYAPYIDQLVALAVRKSAAGDVVVARAIASLVGCATKALPAERVHALVTKLAADLEPNASGTASGRDGEDERAAHILCLGQIIVACQRRSEVELNLKNEYAPENPLSIACMHMTRRVVLAIEASDVVRVAACLSIMDIGAVSTLPIPKASREIFLASLTGLLKLHSTSTKLAQVAAETIGRLCIGEPRPSFKKKAIDTLLHVCKDRKEDEIRFVAAESLVRCASGFDAPSPTALEQAGESKNDVPDETVAEALQGVLHLRTDPFDVKQVLHECMDGEEPSAATAGLQLAITGAIDMSFDERPTARAGGCICLVTFLRLLGRPDDKDEANKIGSFKLTFGSESDEARFKQQQKCLVDHLEQIQRAFTVLLGDRSEFVQQLSSCGVALAYRMCPPNQQSDLVSALVRSLTASKSKSAATVPGDQGSLLELGTSHVKEETGNNPKSATYKELCTLAQDMGQPELVYKFMDLAGHAALWNNRKGAALAGSALLGGDMAAEQLKPHVKSLLPRLYVYCYDPTESVRVAMGSVLGAVIKAGGLGSVYVAVTTHFNVIIPFCLKSMTSRQWRSREAGCGALRDALASRTWEQVHEYLKEFWYLTQRGMDDIKETVRKAAGGTARALAELSIHLCDPGQVGVDIAKAASNIVIPAVMPGILHSDNSIRSLCSNVMSKLIRHGGDALRPSVPELVSSLLEAATEMDTQALNYVQYHVDDPNALESARVEAASSMAASPLVDSLERLAWLIGETNAEDTVRSMTRLAKIGVGIPTRAGTARFFSSVLKSRAAVVEPFAAKLMYAAFSAAAMEHNATLRAAWCKASGTAAKLCKAEEVSHFVDRITELASSEDERDRTLASFVAVGLWHESPDTARAHASALLPIAYMGCHETDQVDGLEQQLQSEDSTSSTTAQLNWARVWDEGAPNPKAALRLYAAEITDMCEKRLRTSGQYRVKRAAARALGAVAEAWNKDSAHSMTVLIQRGVQVLVQALSGHIWDGKIVVLQSVGTVAGQCGKVPEIWGGDSGIIALVRLLFTESKRGKREYRIAAIDSIGKLLSGYRGWPTDTDADVAGENDKNDDVDDVDLFDEVYKHLEEYWADFNLVDLKQAQSPPGADNSAVNADADVRRVVWETGSDANAVDARNKARKTKRLLCVATIRCLECALGCNPRSSSTTGGRQNIAPLAQLSRMVDVLHSVVQSDWEVRLAAMTSLEKFIKRFDWTACTTQAGDDQNITRKLVEMFECGLNDSKYAAVRKKTCECLSAFIQHGGQRHKVIVAEHSSIPDMVAKASKEDSDHSAQMEAQKLQTILQ